MRIKDRPEYATKPGPLTLPRETSVAEAVARMTDHNYGCVIVTDADGTVEGVLTERDVMKRLVNKGLDARTTRIGEIMTSNPRKARDTDDVRDWLRIMSNERFRRLPVLDADGRLVHVMTQGDFVSYTWPDLLYGDRRPRRAAADTRTLLMIVAGIMLYTLVMILLLRTL